MSIIAVTPSNVYDEKEMEYLLKSSKANNFTVEVIGLGKPFSWLNRMRWFRDYLATVSKDTIICFTDAYDVFYTTGLDAIREKFLAFDCDIVWSAEKCYAHQLESDKEFYDKLCDSGLGYKYLNGGTFIGYAGPLLTLFTHILEISLHDKAFIQDFVDGGYPMYPVEKYFDDQMWISHHLRKYWKKYNIKLDYYCSIFYIPSEDTKDIDSFITKDIKDLRVIETGKIPCVIHVPWKAHYKNILTQLYTYKYGGFSGRLYFPTQKSYSWHGNLDFLQRGRLFSQALGWGYYIFTDTYIAEIHLAKQTYILGFSADYSEFSSLRVSDGEYKKGVM
jgi:hypothetical protein